MDYGEHCAHCGRLDFLPIDCHKCGKVYCGDHRVHNCVPLAVPVLKPRSNALKRDDKNTEILETPKPPAKLPTSTKVKTGQRLGSSSGVKNSRASAALQRLKNLVNTSAPKPAKVRGGITPEQKREATGDHRVPLADRIYLQIERPPAQIVDVLTKKETLRPAKTVWMFFDKSLNAGQVLDRAAKQLNVPSGALEAKGKTVDAHCQACEFAGTKLALVAVK